VLHERILRAALEEFLAHGFGAASIEGIARAAQVNKDTIYRQFGAKELLYRTSVRRALQAVPQPMQAAFTQRGDVAATLANAMRQIHQAFTTPAARQITSMTVRQAALFPDLAAAARDDAREYLQPLADYLRELHSSGVLRLDDPEEAAEMLASAALRGVRFLFEPTLRGEALDRFIASRLKVFLRGWDYRPPGQKGALRVASGGRRGKTTMGDP